MLGCERRRGGGEPAPAPDHQPTAEERVMAEREIWKPVPGFEGYEASDLGRVRSVDREIVQISRRGTEYRRFLRGKILAQSPHRDGHLMVALGASGGTKRVHNLVMLAFVGEPPAGLEGCHNDGIPTNNLLTNLRYGTRGDNIADRVIHGVDSRGERNGMARLSRDQALKIRRSRQSAEALASQHGISISHVYRIRSGECWGWLDDDSQARSVRTIK